MDETQVRHGYATPMPFEPVYDYSYDAVMRSFEESLQRLGLSRIDLLYIHDIGRLTHGDANTARMEELTKGGGLKALEELRASKAISGFGMGVNEVAACLEVMDHARLDVILLAGRYTLLEQTPLDDLFPRCAAAGTAIVIGGPLQFRHPGGRHQDRRAASLQLRTRACQCDRESSQDGSGLRSSRRTAGGGGAAISSGAPLGRQRHSGFGLSGASWPDNGALPPSDPRRPVAGIAPGKAFAAGCPGNSRRAPNPCLIWSYNISRRATIGPASEHLIETEMAFGDPGRAGGGACAALAGAYHHRGPIRPLLL